MWNCKLFLPVVRNCYDWSKPFNTKKQSFKMEFKCIFFRKLLFCGLMHSILYVTYTSLMKHLIFAPLNRPLALRGHVTNTSFKQRVGHLLMLEIDRAHKNYLTPEIWEKTLLRGIFYGTLIFQKTLVWFVLAAMLNGILLPSNVAAKPTFCLYLVKSLIVTLRYAVNFNTSSFQHFPWSCVQKGVIYTVLKISFWSCDQLRTYSF